MQRLLLPDPKADNSKAGLPGYGGACCLKLCCKCRWGHVLEGIMGTLLIVVGPPRFDQGLRVVEREELMLGQAFVA
jgi:hypothetical protein